MQDPRQMMDDLFAMKMVSGDFEKKNDGENAGQSGPPSGAHYRRQEGNSGTKPPSGGCLSALILMPVMPIISLLRNLFL